MRNYTQEQIFPEPQFDKVATKGTPSGEDEWEYDDENLAMAEWIRRKGKGKTMVVTNGKAEWEAEGKPGLKKKDQEKKATAPTTFFQIHTDVSTMTGHEKFASADRENFCRVGYFIEDNRPMEKLAKIVERPISEGIETVGDNGAYEIMKIDGSHVKAIVGTCIPIPRLENDMGSGLCEPVCAGSLCGEPNLAQTPERNIITWDGAESVLSTRDLAYGKHVMDAGNPGIEASAMKTGKVYCLISPAGEITPAFMVQEVKSGKDQIKTFKIATSAWSTQSLVLNPDASQEICDAAGVINSKYRAIRLDHKKPKTESTCSGGEGESWTLDQLILGNGSSFDSWLYDNMPVKKASLPKNVMTRSDVQQARKDEIRLHQNCHEPGALGRAAGHRRPEDVERTR